MSAENHFCMFCSLDVDPSTVNDNDIIPCEPGKCLGYICQKCGIYFTTCTESCTKDIIDVVGIRLKAYRMYQEGSVLWTHPDVEVGIRCPHPFDVDNPNTYFIPVKSGDTITNMDCERIPPYEDDPDGGWNWGILHAAVEELATMGWIPQPKDEYDIVM